MTFGTPSHQTIYTLTVQCADQKGIIAAIAQIISESNGNILDLSQHTATDIGQFFLKAIFTSQSENAQFNNELFQTSLNEIKERLNLDVHLFENTKKARVALFVSKTKHCLYELLLAHSDDELNCDIACILSNHMDLAPIAKEFNIPFYLVPSTLEKSQQEEMFDEILGELDVDTLVLARYMQVLRPEMTQKWPNKIINIHHGFLPAFKGAKPYHQAWAKGVKLIGATAHFANEDLDQGPIIAQEVEKVSDTCSVSEFIRRGKNIERNVLLKALKLYLDHSVFVCGGRTFII
jgi:formyltetrahydrofolate deformylase